jgi:hypothetical protein
LKNRSEYAVEGTLEREKSQKILNIREKELRGKV